MKGLAIGALARAAGIKAPTIRFYEEIGLIPIPPRTASNRRYYGDADVHRLRFIRNARELGFSVDDVRALLAMTMDPEASCAGADSVAKHHLAEVERKIERLTGLRKELRRMINECGQRSVSDCRIIEVIAR